MNTAIAAVFFMPCGGGAALFLVRKRAQVFLGLLIALATSSSVAFLTMEVLEKGPQIYPVGGWAAPLGIVLRCDGLSLLMLQMTAAVSLVTSIYAGLFFAGDQEVGPNAELFWPLWLFLWGGLNAVFVSGDIFNIYLLLEIVLLSAVALASLGRSHAALISSFRYLIAATAAALFYLLGVTLLYAEYSILDIEGLKGAYRGGFLPLLALLLMTGGLSLKSALFPLHFWLPPAHSAAPAPVSAVLSGLVVKAGFYVTMRIWFELFPEAAPDAGRQFMAVLGAAGILWGSWRALRQKRLKMLIAYSTVAQIGYLFILFPLSGAQDIGAISATTYQIVSHALAKAAMFLAAGAILKAGCSDLLEESRGSFRKVPFAISAIIISGASLSGIAPGGGAKGKILGLLLEAGQWWWGLVIVLGMLLTVAYTIAAVKKSFMPLLTEDSPGGRARSLEILSLSLALMAMTASFFSERMISMVAVGING